ncbi:S-adenosyl-l-methionine hydroxide adenosyltransferase family protein [Bacillus spongiae]|uniref:S-adenosyl-l-methionine hydroxide adenosyltransferase family protein n=1 Tax=Bacillus spongiae TaxID=2683610 RepID=A0ABU8H8J6_9BACI
MSKAIVFQSDFGRSDGAVCAMYGVAHSVDPNIQIFDSTHDIPPYNIWEASYRLNQAASFWPRNTVFVSVVDPGVGSERKSVAARTIQGHYIITPDNGTLMHIHHFCGVEEVRLIDESIHRLPNSEKSHTFHGRDVYAYTGARLAAGSIDFEAVGPKLPLEDLVMLPLNRAIRSDHEITGMVEVLDVRFGNLWTNISRELIEQFGFTFGDELEVTIQKHSQNVYKSNVVYGRSFAVEEIDQPILYVNSLDSIGLAINQGSFAETFNIGTGPNWRIKIKSKGV